MEERTFVLINDNTKDIKKVNRLLKSGFRIYSSYSVNGVTGFELTRFNMVNTIANNTYGSGLATGANVKLTGKG